MGTNAVPEGGPKRLAAWVTGVIVFILWLATAVLGLVEVGLSREIVWGIYARFSTEPDPANLLGQGMIFLTALLWLAYVFGTGEYHWKNAGKPGSWTVLTWAVAIELLILILYFVVAV